MAVFFISIPSNGNGVLCEYLTATTCHACPPVAEALEEIYESHEYPFYFISMVTDRNEEAEERSRYYNVAGYPTAIFNGGYEVVFGKHDKQDYINAIEKCMQRESHISIKVESAWEKEGLSVYANISNNYNSYDGILRIYIVERVSEWRDYDGNRFKYALIGYALNKDISLKKGKESFHAVWKGNMSDNILVIAAIFNGESETVYSDPPYNTHKFNAHFVDAVALSIPTMDMPPRVYFIKKPDEISGYNNISFKWGGSDDKGFIEYSYKLEGYGEWSEWGNVVSINYTLNDGKYKFMVRARDSMGQITQISYSFTVDTSPPQVVYTYPKNNAIDFKPYEEIVIKFSHPMKKVNIKFSPSVAYTTRWVNDYEVHIKPLSMEYEKRYTLSIMGERKSGQKMKEAYVISFETSPPDMSKPKVKKVEPYYEEYYDGIEIEFSKPMDTLIYKGIEIEPYIPYTHSWKENDTLLVITLLKIIPGKYNVSISEYMQDKYGNKLNSPFKFQFYITVPSIVFNSAYNETIGMHDSIEIKFSHPMNKKSVENGIKIIPSCEYSIRWINEREIEIIANWSADEYIVRIEGAKDIRNLSIKNYSFHFNIWKPYYEHSIKTTPSFSIAMLILSLLLMILKRRK